MQEKLTGIIVLAGLILSVVGAVMGYEQVTLTGNLMLLVIATIVGYRFLKFHLLIPVSEFTGTCIEQQRFSSHYMITFRTGAVGTYSGRASLPLGEKIKMGNKALVKVKGPVILDIKKLK